MKTQAEANHRGQKNGYLWLQLLIVVLVGLAAMTAVMALNVVKEALVRTTGESLALAAAEVAEKLDRVISERFGDVQMAARTLSGRSNAYIVKDFSAYLSEMKQAYPAYRWLGITNRTGLVTAATNETSRGQDLSRNAWFRAARDHGRVVTSDVQPFEASDGGMDVIVFAAPIHDAKGQFEGVLTAVVTMQTLEDLVTRTIQVFRLRQGFLGTLQYQFLNARGDAVVDSDLEYKGLVNLKEVGLPSATLGESRRPGFVEEDHLRDHTLVITGYAHTQGIHDFKGPDWVVLLQMKESELIGPPQEVMTRLGLVATGIALPLLALLLWMQKRLRREWGDAQTEKQRAVAAEERLRSIVQSSKDAILSIESEGHIVFWNTAAERMFGYSAAHMFRRSC